MAAVNYKLIKGFFTKEELPIIQKYCFNKLDTDKDYELDGQVFSPAWYNDPLMTSLLDNKLSLVEKESDLKLFPTYAYWRYYVFGGTLATHRDRPSCEISVTTCIKKYDNWPIEVEGTSFELDEGDGVLYAGCDQWHGRPGVYKGEGLAQVFLHYVNQNGPHKNHAYDAINKSK
tara:strand:+ start:69 stop:590 length:522 start_codon:yes stop_codon:yes gene_type:complete